MLEMKNVTKAFGAFKALDDLSLHVPKGCVYGLVGPNGAGKTTVIRHLAGIYRPDSGTVTVDGQEMTGDPNLKERIGYISDDVFYFPAATMEDMHRFYRDMYSKFDEALYEKLKEIFPLPAGPIRRFSKGMQKQAAILLGLSAMPRYLLCDETFDGLDPVIRLMVKKLLAEEIAERGATVMISSHNLRELEDVCDHVGIMNKGKVLLERSLSDLQDNTVKLQVAFGGDEPEMPADLNVLHHEKIGRVHTYIVRGNQNDILAQVSALQPILLEAIPLTLEEIFIYELGGADYAVHDIVL